MNYALISIDRIFTKLGRDIRHELDDADVIEWTGEALEFIGASKSYEERVVFIEVINHQADLPKGLQSIIQVAKNNNWQRDYNCSPKAVTEALLEDIPSIPVTIDAEGMPVDAYDVAYYRPFFDLRLEVNGWSNSAYYKRQFTPVRLATNTMFNSIVCKNTGMQLQTGKEEYKVIMGKSLRFSFKTGQVAVACLITPTDPETGFPLVPDEISHTTAIVKYIALKKAERAFDRNEAGSGEKVNKYTNDWHWYCKQSKVKSIMPDSVDELQNILDSRSYLIPQNNRYYGFFGNLATPNNRLYSGTVRNLNSSRIAEGTGDEIIITNNTEIINNFGVGDIAEDNWTN